MQYNMNILLDPIVNFGKATVSIGYSNTDTVITLNGGEGVKLPDPSIDGGSFNLIWFNNTDYADPADDPNVEIVRCISRVTDTLVLMRGQEGTSASNKNISGKIYKVILSQTKKTIGDIQTDAQSRVDTHSALDTGVHGVGVDIVDAVGARNTAISDHSIVTSSVHNFDASGNAPPQLHGISVHDATTVDGGAALSLANQIPAHGSAQHTGTIGTWGQIDKTTSSIADITTKSHTSLTDIGTNTHPTIDTAITNSTSHIAAITGIHGTTGNLVATGAAVAGQYSSARYTTTVTLDWNNGNVQYIVLANGGQTFTFANPRDGGRYMIILKQPAAGAVGTVTWPATVLWSGGTAPTLTTTLGKVDLITFVYDGANGKYYGGSALNY